MRGKESKDLSQNSGIFHLSSCAMLYLAMLCRRHGGRRNWPRPNIGGGKLSGGVYILLCMWPGAAGAVAGCQDAAGRVARARGGPTIKYMAHGTPNPYRPS